MQPSIPVVLDANHGSGAGVQDPAPASSLSAHGGAPAPGLTETATMDNIDHGGDTLSDLPDLSAEMPDGDDVTTRRAESAARTACRHASTKLKASSGPREIRSVSQGKRRPGPRGRMPMSRSPSPGKRPEIRDPVPLGPVADGTSIDHRAERLEQMARSEHAWRDELTNAVRALMQTADRDHLKLREHDEGIRSFERLGFDLMNMKAKL